MATAVQQRRGTTSEHSSFGGLEGEITVDTELKTVIVHDGSGNAGSGTRLAKHSELGATVTVTDNSDDTAFPVVFHNESSAGTLLDDTGEFTYNPNDGVLTVPFRLDLGGQGSSNGSQINFSDGSDADFFRILELNSDIYFSVTGTNADMLFSTSHSNSVYKFDVGSSDTKVEIAHDNTTLFHNLIVDQGTIALKDASDHVTTIQENAGGNITLTLPSATGTIALTSDVAGTTLTQAAQTNITSLGTLTGLTTGATTVNGALTVNDNSVEIVSTTDTTAINPILSLYRNRANPAAEDDLGAIQFHGKDSAGNKTLYAQIHGFAQDETTDTEDGEIHFSCLAGALFEDPVMKLTKQSLEMSANNDIRLGLNSNIRFEGTSTSGSHRTTLFVENPTANRTVNLPNASGTLALTTDIGFVAPTTVVGSAAIDDMTSNISKKYVHTGSAVTLKFPNVTASSNLGDTWVVVNAGTDTLTFDRVTSGSSQFKKLNGSTVASAANTITLSKGGVAELTVTADNEIIIFGSGVI